MDGDPLRRTDPLGLMGQGSGANGRLTTLSPPAGAQCTVGAGGMFHTPLGIGLAADAGIAVDTNGSMCVYSNVCYSVGPGMAAELGIQGGIGSGPLSSGTTTQKGVTWTGGAGLMGQGGFNFASDGQAGANRGMAGVGGGAAMTYQQCTQTMICRKN